MKVLTCSRFRRDGRQRPETEKADEHRDDDQGRTGIAFQPSVEAVGRRHRRHRRVVVAGTRGRPGVVLQPAAEGEANDGTDWRTGGRAAAAA